MIYGTTRAQDCFHTNSAEIQLLEKTHLRYNTQHRHSGIGLLTPETVHRGRGEAVRAARQAVLADAYVAHPERFVRKHPEPPKLPTAVWINPPEEVPPRQ